MGVNNRQRRAAKQRKRERERTAPDRPAAAHPREETDWDAAAAHELVEARVRAVVRRLGGRRLGDAELADATERLVRTVAPHPRHVVETVVGDVLLRLTEAVAGGGWTPADLAELVRRNLGHSHLPTLVAALHEDDRRHDRGHAWAGAVRAVGAASDMRLGTPAGLASALGLAVLLAHTPQLADTIATDLSDGGPEHPKLARVRALLAKAESTEFDEEAEALSAKAQELITRYALDRLVDGPAGRDGEAAGVRRLWLDAPYVRAKASLVAAVAAANRCRAASAERLGFSVVVGATADLDAVEMLVTSLLVQADVAMLRHGRRADATGTARTRSFRQSFLTAYAFRVGERLAAASTAAARAHGADLLPVLRSQEERVAEEFARLVPHTVGRAASVSNGEGWVAGLAAADLAVLEVNRRLEDAG